AARIRQRFRHRRRRRQWNGRRQYAPSEWWRRRHTPGRWVMEMNRRDLRAGSPRPQKPAGSRRSQGAVMVIAIAVVLVLASLALIFAQEMQMEMQAAANRAASLQATATLRGALTHVQNQLTTS